MPTIANAGVNGKVDENGNLTINVGNAGDVIIRFAEGVDVLVFRGTADTDITGIAVRQADGSRRFIYSAAGAVTNTATRP
jgi:hypothetical protein